MSRSRRVLGPCQDSQRPSPSNPSSASSGSGRSMRVSPCLTESCCVEQYSLTALRASSAARSPESCATYRIRRSSTHCTQFSSPSSCSSSAVDISRESLAAAAAVAAAEARAAAAAAAAAAAPRRRRRRLPPARWNSPLAFGRDMRRSFSPPSSRIRWTRCACASR